MPIITIPDILADVSKGQVRVPAFQRGFVWEPDRVAYLMDSIYKRFPIGSLLLWRTKEKLKVERQLGPFCLPDPDADYPIDYVLDGQQRITSIFGVFQSTLEQDGSVDWLDIYYDIQASDSPQDTQFLALDENEVEEGRHFAMNTLFNTTEYGKMVRALEDDEIAEKLDKMREVFQTARIPAEQTTTEDKATVAIIFERVNRQGVELDTFQLLTAWTWSEDFQLQEQFEELADDIRPFGFGDIGEDTNLLLRCCSAILTADASPQALMSINGEELRKNFDKVKNGIKYSIDFIKTNFKAQKLYNLPFSTLIVPLSAFFAVSGDKEITVSDSQRRALRTWFWRAGLSRRYSSGVLRNLKTDIEEANKLRDGEESSLGDFTVTLNLDHFSSQKFGMGNVNSKTFILMLADTNPLSFVSGQSIDLAEKLKAANRAEFHHLMPKKFLTESGQSEPPDSILANFAFISRSDNRTLGGVAPSEYREKMPDKVEEILSRSLVPMSLFDDDYQKFVDDRSEVLLQKAKELAEIEIVVMKPEH